MARKFTGTEFHGVIDEGRTGRIIARAALRRTLGNPKKRMADLTAFAFDLYARGYQQGAEAFRGRIQNSVAALDYGGGYYVAPTVETEDGQRRADNPDTVLATPCDGAVGSKQHFPEAYTVDRHRGYTDPEAGSFPSS